LAATVPLAPHRIAEVVRRAAGNPMFVLELTRAVCERGDDAELTGTLEEMLAAQIDRLEPAERSVLRAAAVLGVRVHWPLVEQITGAPVPADVRQRLSTYVSDATFANALVRDAAYEGLPFRRRVELHGRVGDLCSLVPVSGPAAGVRTRGLRFPLDGEVLHPGSTRGVSNELLEPTAHVVVERGVLLAVLPNARTAR